MKWSYDADSKVLKSEVLRVLGIAFVVLGVVLWVVAPFAAINLLTIDNQPTAYEVFANKNIRYIGNIRESDAYACAGFALAGFVGCFIGFFFKKYWVALISSGGSVYGFLQIMGEVSPHSYEDLFGIGFWGVVGVLLVLFICSMALSALTSPQKKTSPVDPATDTLAERGMKKNDILL